MARNQLTNTALDSVLSPSPSKARRPNARISSKYNKNKENRAEDSSPMRSQERKSAPTPNSKTDREDNEMRYKSADKAKTGIKQYQLASAERKRDQSFSGRKRPQTLLEARSRTLKAKPSSSSHGSAGSRVERAPIRIASGEFRRRQSNRAFRRRFIDGASQSDVS